MSNGKWFATVALALTGALGGTAAQAGEVDVQWSIVIGSPVYTQPVPVYTRPWPVYTQPVPVYTRPWPAYSRPAPVWTRPAPVHRHGGYGHSKRWDRDGDGIPNRADRVYNPRWDRDGDGIPNRHDRYQQTRHDRDGDGVRNRHDRHAKGGWRDR